MPIKIHHGPPGAYKTSGAVKDDLIPWAIEGRVVVTNVRGLGSTKKFKKRFASSVKPTMFQRKVTIPKTGKGFKLIFVDTETTAGKERMRTWFMWAPKGCAFLIDEIQTIYPQKFTLADYKAIAYESTEAAKEDDNRPEDVYIAFEKHRHYNWDFVVTAPSIKKVAPIIRDVTEAAYYHSNKGKIGLKGLYLEAMHNPDDSGKTESQWITHNIKRAPKQAFQLYGSTDTGIVKDTESGKNIFKQPKIIGITALFAVVLIYNVSKGNPLNVNKAEASTTADLVTQPHNAEDAVMANHQSLQADSVVSPNATRVLGTPLGDNGSKDSDPLANLEVSVGGIMSNHFVYVSMNGTTSELTKDQLISMGYTLKVISTCLWKLETEFTSRWITCQEPDNVQPQQATVVETLTSF